MKISELVLELQIPRIDDVYYPSDDSFLVIDYLDTPEFEKLLRTLSESKKELNILDMGCGTGILGLCITYKVITTKLFDTIHLTYTDVNPKAIETAKFMINKNLHHLKRIASFKDDGVTVDYKISDLFDEIPSQIFDLVVFNPPYLPQDEEIKNPKPIDQALYGGPEGITVLKNFFAQLNSYIQPESLIYFIVSSLGALHKLLPGVSLEYHITLLQNIHMFFEDFGLFHAKKKPKITNNL